jgi:hypothetical protein
MRTAPIKSAAGDASSLQDKRQRMEAVENATLAN